MPSVPITTANQLPATTTLPMFFVAEVVDAVAGETEPDADDTDAFEVMDAVLVAPAEPVAVVVAVIMPVIAV